MWKLNSKRKKRKKESILLNRRWYQQKGNGINPCRAKDQNPIKAGAGSKGENNNCSFMP
jgi:hypothetical protein